MQVVLGRLTWDGLVGAFSSWASSPREHWGWELFPPSCLQALTPFSEPRIRSPCLQSPLSARSGLSLRLEVAHRNPLVLAPYLPSSPRAVCFPVASSPKLSSPWADRPVYIFPVSPAGSLAQRRLKKVLRTFLSPSPNCGTQPLASSPTANVAAIGLLQPSMGLKPDLLCPLLGNGCLVICSEKPQLAPALGLASGGPLVQLLI